ncbi:formimidoylglutamase [Salinimicrobium sp. MT39]|uniref:Formimidoylglutamase n=1 Tax=Salinimicrobium profundisediminis TaxID=2994553 RepID=A0A9X3CZ03_9FLAO|nr:formimidoylglutamase [Salinimicrobium profundisediminis]MCX2839581.1 formimidoylglutamase [Salinimicrobium profundisediminis]
MNQLKFYSEKQVSKLISTRQGETKLGEKIMVATSFEDVQKSGAEIVIFGIPEDIGVRANFGKPGTSNAWQAFLGAFLNVQENQFNSGENVLLLGEINTSEVMEKAGNIDVSDPNYVQKLGDLVEQLDTAVSEVVKNVILAGKFPVIIGGGHNNAFGNLKGASEAFNHPINVLNIDAHTDLRRLEHRHSGNGFSYTFKNGFLERYSVFGLHQNYTPQYIFDVMNASEAYQYHLLEELPKHKRKMAFLELLDFVKQEKFGLELDCDAIANFPSSAVSPAGLELDEAREMIREAAKERNCCYLHICEAVATNNFPTGKALSYLVTDFLKEKTHA